MNNWIGTNVALPYDGELVLIDASKFTPFNVVAAIWDGTCKTFTIEKGKYTLKDIRHWMPAPKALAVPKPAKFHPGDNPPDIKKTVGK